MRFDHVFPMSRCDISRIGRLVPSSLCEPPIHSLGDLGGWVGLYFFQGYGSFNSGVMRRLSRFFGGASHGWLGAKPYAPGSGPSRTPRCPFCGDEV